MSKDEDVGSGRRCGWLLSGLFCALAIAAFAVAFAMYLRIRAFDAKNRCDVLAGLSAEDMVRSEVKSVAGAQSKAVQCVRKEKPASLVTPAALTVRGIEYDGDSDIRVILSDRPDMDAVRNFVTVAPLVDGSLGFRCEDRRDRGDGECSAVLHVTGNFAYRTNVTLTVRKGLPHHGKGVNNARGGSLADDFTRVLRRKDPPPAVAFADNGRYLPPGGREALRIEAIGVTNIATSICRVEPRNVVQLLAREERVYRRGGWWNPSADREDTTELSGVCETGAIRCANRPCERETCLLPVAMRDGGPWRGVFLVSIRNGDRPREEREWLEQTYNPCSYRLVCLSDLGLSVRNGRRGVGVWVTSLLSGKPVANAGVEVYSSSNILLAEGRSDANGWCEPQMRTKGRPFAVIVRTQADMTFLAIRDSMLVDETNADGARPEYMAPSDVDAFAWTERGIYRHGERIFVHAILRNGSRVAPRPMPISLCLRNPKGEDFAVMTIVTDANGALTCDRFSVPEDQPSGKWKVLVRLPGKDGRVLAEREVKVEEFAPPQIRVGVCADERLHPTNFHFSVSAEHLFGGPACALACEGAVVFEDVPFAPNGWKGFSFGNDQLGLKPNFRRLPRQVLNERGICGCSAPLLADSGLPKSAVRVTAQGVVFEDGGRPATARKSVVCHYYPYYIGSSLSGWLSLPKTTAAKISFVCVDHAGTAVAAPRKLIGRIERIDSVYSYRQVAGGRSTWDCERVRTTVFDSIPITIGGDGRGEYDLPMRECGDYVLTVVDPETGVSFGRAFYLSDWGDDTVRAPMSNPTEVSIRPDKSFYRVGERPRLVVKSPFAGYAIMSVMRDDMVYEEVFNMTNATSEIVLRPISRDWAPNADVAVSVVQSVEASAKHLAARAHGRATIRVRPAEEEIAVGLEASVDMSGCGAKSADQAGGCRVTVDLSAAGATSAVVTLVDEGINLLTGEPVPDPVGWLARPRDGRIGLYDLYSRVLPVAEDGLSASGVKTGGGCGAEMLGRVSPVPTRRFRPLVRWNESVALTNGAGRVVFNLPEFVGEVRVTAVAYSPTATGAASLRKKISPRLVMQPDAPRFVAPGDSFDVTLTLRNASGRSGHIGYDVGNGFRRDGITVPAGWVTNVVCRMKAPDQPGEMDLRFRAEGLGEVHQSVISLPVRPAVAWRESAGMIRIEPGSNALVAANGEFDAISLRLSGTPVAELVSALAWLAEYPHGCLEQTASRIFPLIAAGGILNASSSVATNREEYVRAGVRRVESMIRENDFVMWPDCSYAPWDREVSLYAAHFLIEADRAGYRTDPVARAKVVKFLRKWAMDANDDVSAYACHTLAIAGAADGDRMLRLYDNREKLSALARSRLARAFVAAHDRSRAEGLMKYALEPQSVLEASFHALSLLDLNPDDERIPQLLAYLNSHRDGQRLSWGTTAENAHALLAIGAYFTHHPIKATGKPHVVCTANESDADAAVATPLGDRESAEFRGGSLRIANDGEVPAFVAWRRRELPLAESVTNEANGIFISRRYVRPDGTPADLSNLTRGEMLVACLTITSDVARVVGDLVVEDLLAGAFEPVHRELAPNAQDESPSVVRAADWVMRKDARDDRVLVFSKKFSLEIGHEAKVCYPVRVVSAGDFILPGPSVEGMYNPQLRARCAPDRIVVRH